AELIFARDSQARAAEQIRRRFVAEGGDAALKRAHIEAEQHEVQKRCAAIEHELRELANGLLPFAIAPKVVRSFQKALDRKGGAKARKGTPKQPKAPVGAGRRGGASDRKGDWTAKFWSDQTRFLGVGAKGDDHKRGSPRFLKKGGEGPAA